MSRIRQNSVRGKLKHTLPLNQKKNLLLLNTISNPAAVTPSPSGIFNQKSSDNLIQPEIFIIPDLCRNLSKICNQQL